jgi:hypothetical protein
VQHECCFDRLVNYYDFGYFFVMNERPIMLDRRALAKAQVLPSIWGSLHRNKSKCPWEHRNTRFLHYFPCSSSLPCLTEHLIIARKFQLALTVTRQSASNHQ